MNNRKIEIVFVLLYMFFNPFPLAKAFWRNSSSRLLKTLWPKGKWLITSNFPFDHNVFSFILQLSYLLWSFFRFLPQCFQSRLLQICCMWERVKCVIYPIYDSCFNDNLWKHCWKATNHCTWNKKFRLLSFCFHLY